MTHPVGVTRNGAQVYAYLTNSQLSKRVSRQPQLLTLAKEMLATMTLRAPTICVEYDMQRQIGYDFIIDTTDKDIIFYARILKDDVYTRFVKNGEPTPARHLSAKLLRDSNNNYELSDLWIGRLIPPRSGSADETAESKAFWSNHAFIFVDQPLQAQTITRTCPY